MDSTPSRLPPTDVSLLFTHAGTSPRYCSRCDRWAIPARWLVHLVVCIFHWAGWSISPNQWSACSSRGCRWFQFSRPTYLRINLSSFIGPTASAGWLDSQFLFRRRAVDRSTTSLEPLGTCLPILPPRPMISPCFYKLCLKENYIYARFSCFPWVVGCELIFFRFWGGALFDNLYINSLGGIFGDILVINFDLWLFEWCHS